MSTLRRKLSLTRFAFLASALLTCFAGNAQGLVTVNNLLNHNRFILAGVDPADGSASSIGQPDYEIHLFGGPADTPTDSLIPLQPFAVTMRGRSGSEAAGYITPATITVPGVGPGSPADVLVRVTASWGRFVDFGPFRVPSLGGAYGGITPPNLNFGVGLLVVSADILNVPEPQVMVLFTFGFAGLFYNLVEPLTRRSSGRRERGSVCKSKGGGPPPLS